MSLERELEKLVQLKQMERCEKCQHPLQYIGSGRYRCSFCGAESLDDFGKIKSMTAKQIIKLIVSWRYACEPLRLF